MNDFELFSACAFFLVLLVLGKLGLAATQHHLRTLPLQERLFFCAFTLRFAMSIVICQSGLVALLGDEDSGGWFGGVKLYQQWQQQGVGFFDLPAVLTGAFEGQHRGYRYLLSTLFHLTGVPTRLMAATLNGCFGALTAVFTYRVANRLFSSWVAERAGWCSCLFPSLIIWSAQTVKEPVVMLLETVALYGCVHMKCAGLSFRHALTCVLAILLLIPFRFYAAYLVGAAVILALVLPRMREGKTTLTSALVVAAVLLPILISSGLLARHEAEFEKFDVQRIQHFGQAVATGPGGGSGVTTHYDMQTPHGFGMAAVVGAAHVLLAPFPWQLGHGSLRMLLTLPELLVWWWLFFAGVLPGGWYAMRHRFSDVQLLLLFVCGLGLLYSLLFGNVGLAYRQRTQLLPWLLIFAMVGLEQRRAALLASPRVRTGQDDRLQARYQRY